MSEKNLTHVLAMLNQAGVSGRSEAYRWMRDNHQELSAVLEGRRPSWTKIAEAIGEAGVLGHRGQKLLAKNARLIWRRVCRDVEKERQTRRAQERASEPATTAREEPKRFNPSRLPATYRPDVEIRPQPSLPATTSGPYPVPATIDLSEIEDVITLPGGKQLRLTEKQKENLAKNRARYKKATDYHDRYIQPPPRK
jgi:hypothetical protein